VTTLDALWAGVPVLTIAGATQASRTGASILASAGLADLVMPDIAGYEIAARAYAADPARLASLRRRLADAYGTSPLFSSTRLARAL
jgi:protein O-GlcNAc transferase